MDVPFGTRLFQRLIRAHRAFLARAADRKFHRHDRKAEDEQEDDVADDKRAAAILAYQPRELPYVAHADRTSRGKQDEAKARAESFSLHCFLTPCFSAYYLCQTPVPDVRKRRRASVFTCISFAARLRAVSPAVFAPPCASAAGRGRNRAAPRRIPPPSHRRRPQACGYRAARTG